jgi:hypothetical protein
VEHNGGLPSVLGIKTIRGLNMVGNTKHEKQNPAKMREIDKEKEYLDCRLKIAKVKLARTMKDSLMRKFWEKEIKRIQKKLGK